MSTSTPVLAEFRMALGDGVHAALRFLNSRTPHRFTGVYRFDGDMLRNMALFDRFEPDQLRGIDIPISHAYCANMSQTRESLEFADARTASAGDAAGHGRFKFLSDSPVVCYSGVLITNAAGKPYGTLCHYDVQHCQTRTSDLPMLKVAVPYIYEFLKAPQQPA